MIKFEKVSRFNEIELEMPSRKTSDSAGYDFIVAEEIIIPPYNDVVDTMVKKSNHYTYEPIGLEEMASITKSLKAKVTLVSTGMKCYLPKGYYLELSVRSSTPLKHWLILGNGVGIIDADYADNEDNEGEIFFQLINLSPFPIQLKRGDRIGQGIIKKYEVTDDDNAEGERTGGFGSTSENAGQIKVQLNVNGEFQKDLEKAVRDEFDRAIKNATFEPNYNAMTMAIEPGNYDGRGMRTKAGIIDEAIYSPSRDAIIKEIEKSLNKGGIGV